MKYSLAFSIFFLIVCFANAQERTYKMSEEASPLYKNQRKNIMVITFENKMYRSDVDREIGEYNKLDQQQIQSFFQKALTQIISDHFAKAYNVWMLDEELDPDSSAEILAFIRSNIQYEYEDMPQKKNKLEEFLDKKETKKEKSGLINGELAVKEAKAEKYMNAYIKNDTLIQYLTKSFGLDYIILVNEFDLTYHVSNADMAAYGGIQKKAKAHYSIFDKTGELVVSGAQNGMLESQEKDINLIAKKALPELANKILVDFQAETGTLEN